MQIPEPVRVRFAPSPTGEPHVGNIRTAIFDWLLARRTGGAFVVRVEDTDQARKVEGATEKTLDALRWLGLDWDEGPDIGGPFEPYQQSLRLDHYRRTAETLIDAQQAYRCYCSPERLSDLRSEQGRLSRPLGYDRRCRRLSLDELRSQESGGAPSVVRFAMPADGTTTLVDLIHGDVSFENHLVDDFVIMKSDGFPTYHLASVVDDHAMQISHVLRGEEWLPSAPRHVRLYEALGWEPPQFAHLPTILGPDRSKLSKRHGAKSVLDYREMGFIPVALVNFLSLLGWSLDDKTEIFDTEELVKVFSLERVGKAGAVFDMDKLQWLNGHHIRRLGAEGLADALLDHWRRYPPDGIPEAPDKGYLLRIVPLIRERLKTLNDAAPLVAFFFAPGVDYEPEELVQKKMDPETTQDALAAALKTLEKLPSFDVEAIEGALRPLAVELGIKAGQLFGSLRIATTGLRVAPPLFETLDVLGRERSLADVREAIRRLSNATAETQSRQ